MKTILAALASASLLAAPLATLPATATAAPHGYGGFHGGYGGFHGGYGWRGYGYRGYPYFFGGLALGAALWDPWYYGYYGYPGYYYGYADPYGYYGPPPPPPPPSGYAQPAQAQPQAQQGQACGSWNWNAAQSKYDWVPCPATGSAH
jgi:hypothetical protein